jgi:hypothetical protein
VTDSPSEVSLFYKLDTLTVDQVKKVRSYMKKNYGLSQDDADKIGEPGTVFTYGPSNNYMPLIPDNIRTTTHNLSFSFGSIIQGLVGIFNGVVSV